MSEWNEEVTAQDIEHFNRICKDAAELAKNYQQQSEQLKGEIVGMVSMYNKGASPQSAIPADKIIQITSDYQEGMKSVQAEYNQLSASLKDQEQERNLMMQQINDCFTKLSSMEIKLKAKAKTKQQALQKEQEGEGEKEGKKESTNPTQHSQILEKTKMSIPSCE